MEKDLVAHYFHHGFSAANQVLLRVAIMRVSAVAALIFSFNFFAAYFALKRRHLVLQLKHAQGNLKRLVHRGYR
jgi:hypothetical protein